MAKQSIETFILRNDFYPQVKLLTREQRGDLLIALFAHSAGEELPDMDQVTQMCFLFIRSFMDDNRERFDARCEKNRANGVRGGRPTRPSEKTNRFSDETEKTNRFSDETEKTNRFSDETEKTNRFSDETEKTNRFSDETNADARAIARARDTESNSYVSNNNTTKHNSKNILSLSLPLSLSLCGKMAPAMPSQRERNFQKFEKVEKTGKNPMPEECSGAAKAHDAADAAETGQISKIAPQRGQVASQAKEVGQIEENAPKSRMLSVLCLDRGLLDPAAELERFENHYAKTGWVDANGNPIRSPLAALKAWKPAPDARKLPPGVVKFWRAAAEAIAAAHPSADCCPMFEHFRGLEHGDGSLRITASNKRLVDFIEQKEVLTTFWQVVKTFMPDVVALNYRVLR